MALLTCSAPGHPETNGLAERYVGHFQAKMKLLGSADDMDTRLQRFLSVDLSQYANIKWQVSCRTVNELSTPLEV